MTAAFALDDFNAAVELIGDNVPVMEESVLLEANIHEGGLKHVFQVANAALENAAYEAFFRGAFDIKFLELSVFSHRDTRFERLGVDDHFFMYFLHRFDQPLDLL